MLNTNTSYYSEIYSSCTNLSYSNSSLFWENTDVPTYLRVNQYLNYLDDLYNLRVYQPTYIQHSLHLQCNGFCIHGICSKNTTTLYTQCSCYNGYHGYRCNLTDKEITFFNKVVAQTAKSIKGSFSILIDISQYIDILDDKTVASIIYEYSRLTDEEIDIEQIEYALSSGNNLFSFMELNNYYKDYFTLLNFLMRLLLLMSESNQQEFASNYLEYSLGVSSYYICSLTLRS